MAPFLLQGMAVRLGSSIQHGVLPFGVEQKRWDSMLLHGRRSTTKFKNIHKENWVGSKRVKKKEKGIGSKVGHEWPFVEDLRSVHISTLRAHSLSMKLMFRNE